MQKLRNLTTTSIKSLDEVIEAIGHIVNTVVYVLAGPSVHDPYSCAAFHNKYF